MLLNNLRRALLASVLFFLLLGLGYPALMVGVGGLFFKSQATGQITRDGSALIGQHWSGPRWFQGRPDADNPMASGPQNYGPKSKLLLDFSRSRVAALRREGITPTNDLVTGSGSGIDPDIAPADAFAQARAVARANGLPLDRVDTLIKTHIIGRYWGFLGSPYIDVLELNEALAALAHR